VLFQHALVMRGEKKPKEALHWFDEAERHGYRERGLFEQRGLTLLDLEDWPRAERDLQSLRGWTAPVPAPFAVLAYRKEHQALLDKNWEEALSQSDAAL